MGRALAVPVGVFPLTLSFPVLHRNTYFVKWVKMKIKNAILIYI
jgi:hypothetical protein